MIGISNKVNRIPIFYWIIAIIFITFMLFLSFHMRLCSDDLFQVDKFFKQGWYDSVANYNFNIRWSSFLIFNSIFVFNKDIFTLHWNVFFYCVFIFALMIISISFLIKVLIFRFTNKKCPESLSVLIAVFFCSVLYFSTSESIEIWFWLGASTIYLIPLIFLILGFAFLFSNSNSFFSYLLLIISFIIVGGGVEIFALITFFLLCLIVLVSFFKNDFLSLKNLRKKGVLSIISVLVLLIVNLSSKGTTHRHDLESVSKHSFDLIAEFNRFVMSFLEFRNILALILLVLVLKLGKVLADYGLQFKVVSLKKIIGFNFLFLLVIALITFIPLIYVFHDFGPKRAWFPINFFISLSLFSITLYLGNTRKIQVGRWMNLGFGFEVVSVFGLYFFKQNPIVTKFSTQYDARVVRLINLQKLGNKKAIGLYPISDSGMVASCELGNKKGKQNVGLKELLNLDFDIYLIEDVPNSAIKKTKRKYED